MTSFTLLRRSLFTGALLFTSLVHGLFAPNALAAADAGVAPPPAGTGAAAALLRGIVSVEVNHRPVATGIVLARDGRVLTSLKASALGAKDLVAIIYSDGHSVTAKVGHADPETEVALLVPSRGGWTDGIEASDASPVTEALRAAVVNRGSLRSVAVSVQAFRAPPTLLITSEGVSLRPGTPLLASDGRLVAMVGRAFKKQPGHTWSAFETEGIDTAVLKRFLRGTPPSASIPTPWLGIGGMPIVVKHPETGADQKGVRVSALLRGSPAEKGGLLAGETAEAADVIVSVDKVPVETPDALAKSLENREVGEKIALRVLRKAALIDVVVVLQAAPNL